MHSISNETPTRVFISYSRKDAAFADRLVGALRGRRYETLLDREDISGGEAWKERIEGLILQADAVVFVLTPDSVGSPVCDWETRRAVELGKRLLPVCLRRVPDDQTPEQLSRLNYIFADSDSSFDPAVAKLVKAIDVDIAWVRDHTRHVDLAARWESGGRRTASMLRGEELTAAESWLARRQPLAPVVPETLADFLRESRAVEAAALDNERKTLQRTRRLQLGVGGLVLLAAVVVLIGGFGVFRLMSGIGARGSVTLAELAKAASNDADHESAARYALAGMSGANDIIGGYRAAAAEAELRRALSAGREESFLPSEDGCYQGPQFSPDGSLFARPCEGVIHIFDVATGAIRHGLRPDGYRGGYVAFDRDNERLAIVNDDQVRIFRLADGVQLSAFDANTDWSADGVAFSPSGDQVLTSSNDGRVRVWDIASGAMRAVFRGICDDFDFSRDGRYMRCRGAVWDARTYAPMLNLNDDMAFLSNGRVATMASDSGGVVRILNIQSGAEVRRLSRTEVSEFAADQANGRIATLSPVGIQLWDADTGRVIGGFAPGPDNSYGASLQFSADGSRLMMSEGMSTGWDSPLARSRLWDVESATLISEFRGGAPLIGDGVHTVGGVTHGYRFWNFPRADVLARTTEQQRVFISIDDDGSRFATVEGRGPVRVFDLDTRAAVSSLDHAGANWVMLGANGSRAITLTADDWLDARFWDASSGAMLSRIPIDDRNVRNFTMSADSGVVAVLQTRSFFWRPDSPQVRTPFGEEYQPNGLFSPDERTLLAWGSSTDPKLFDVTDGHLIAALPGDENLGTITAAAFSPDGAYIVTGYTAGGLVRVWDARSGVLSFTLTSGQDSRAQINAMAFSADGRFLAMGSADYTTVIWDFRERRALHTLRGHSGWVDSVAFINDGAHVVTAANDGTRLWDVATGRELVLFRPVGIFVYRIIELGEGRLALNNFASAEIWALPPALYMSRAELRREACGRLIPGEVAQFTEGELRAAPVLNPELDADACSPASLWRRLGVYLRGSG